MSGMQIQQIEDEVVRMLGNQVVSLQPLLREILQVEGDYQAGATMDRRCHHMSIIGIGQFNGGYQRLEPGDQTVTYRGIHQ